MWPRKYAIHDRLTRVFLHLSDTNVLATDENGVKFNPFTMNDCDMKTFLKVFLAVQFGFWAVVGLDLFGIYLPIVRELAALIYLTFFPGILLLRILRLHHLGSVESVVYSVGLSLALLMATGLGINLILPTIGIPDPFAFIPLFGTFTLIMLVLLLVAILVDRQSIHSTAVPAGTAFSPAALFLGLVPFIAILGTQLMNIADINILLLALILVLAGICLAVAFDIAIPPALYPLAVLVTALALLYHKSLLSGYLIGWDIHHEFYLAQLVLDGSYWDMSIPFNTNGMLSIVALAPLYATLCNMDLIWVFKIIYPFLFALVPLALYRVVEKQTSGKVAFFSMFFFVSFFTFYSEMLSLARQQIAELFLALTLLALIDKSMDRTHRLTLLLVFGGAMIVSHYGLSYIWMGVLVLALLLLVAIEKDSVANMLNAVHARLSRQDGRLLGDRFPTNPRNRSIVIPYVLLFVVLANLYYLFVSESSSLLTILTIGEKISSSVAGELFNPGTSQGLGIIVSESPSISHNVAKYLHIITQLLIGTGIIAVVFGRRKVRFDTEYFTIGLIFFALNIAGIGLPYFASALNTTRLYQITIIVLAPFCVLGGLAIFNSISALIQRTLSEESITDNSTRALSIFFAIFLAFNSGFLYEIADYSSRTSIAFDSNLDFPIFSDREITGVEWLSAENTEAHPVYVDGNRWWLLQGYIPGEQRYLPPPSVMLEGDSYIYLGKYNTGNGRIRIEYREQAHTVTNYVEAAGIVGDMNRIYTNADAEIYYR
jgi:uncharacterized membrane protein